MSRLLPLIVCVPVLALLLAAAPDDAVRDRPLPKSPVAEKEARVLDWEKLPEGYRAIPGTKVALKPAEGFTLGIQHVGLQHSETQTGISMHQFGVRFVHVAASMTKDKLAEKKITLVSEETVKVDGRPGKLLHVSMTPQNAAIEQWILLVDHAPHTLMFRATMPGKYWDVMGPITREIMTGALISDGPASDMRLGLGYTLECPDSLEATRRLGVNMVYQSTIKVTGAGKPAQVVIGQGAASYAFAKLSDRDCVTVATGRFRKATGVKQPEYEIKEVVQVGPLRGVELAAPKKDKDGTPTLIYQAMLFHGENFTLVQGTIPEKLRDPVLEDVKAMVRSIRRAPAEKDEADEASEEGAAEEEASDDGKTTEDKQ